MSSSTDSGILKQTSNNPGAIAVKLSSSFLDTAFSVIQGNKNFPLYLYIVHCK